MPVAPRPPCPAPRCPHRQPCPLHPRRPYGTRTSRQARGYGAAWERLRREVLAQAGRVCQLAGPGCTHHATQVDHVVPRSQGGADTLDNLQAVCAACHATKTGRQAAGG